MKFARTVEWEGTRRVEAVVVVGAKYPRWLWWLVAGVRAAVVASVKRLSERWISS
jgi:hypothetical protein